jgi:hypothetical protein
MYRARQNYHGVSTILKKTLSIEQKPSIDDWSKKTQLSSTPQMDGNNFHELIKCFVKNKNREVLRILDKP